jgi:hypothetical protein
MIPIKIQCECGQRYAFETEPLGGKLASPVNCPACGADGTAAANEIIMVALPRMQSGDVAAKLAEAVSFGVARKIKTAGRISARRQVTAKNISGFSG